MTGRTRNGMTLAAAVLLLAGAALGGEEPAQPTPPAARPLRIAVVDIDKVFEEYKKGGDKYRQIERKFEPKIAELRQQAQNIRELQRQMNDLPREKALERLKLKQRIEVGMAEISTKEKEINEQIASEEIDAMMDVWDDVLEEVARYAKDNAIDLVIKQQVRSGKPKQKATFHRRISAWTVVYTAAHLDITEKVVKNLNTRYERGLDSEKG